MSKARERNRTIQPIQTERQRERERQTEREIESNIHIYRGRE